MGEKAQKSHARAIKDFADFLRHSPDMATPEELRAHHLHMTNAGVTPSIFNTGMTCEREDIKRFMQFRPEPRRLPVVFSVEEVSDMLMAAPEGCESALYLVALVASSCSAIGRVTQRGVEGMLPAPRLETLDSKGGATSSNPEPG